MIVKEVKLIALTRGITLHLYLDDWLIGPSLRKKHNKHRENGAGGTPSHEALSVSHQGALEISSVIGQPPSLVRNLFSTPRMVAESHKRDERHRPSSQEHRIQLFTDTSNEGWGTHLEQTCRVCGQTGV